MLERQEILRGLRAARQAGERAALATVVNVVGSAYRREGTAMLVREDGSYSCLVSGGCLEPEIVYLAQQVMQTGRPRLQRYNLDEERMFGLGIGCAGEVDLYIEALGAGALNNDAPTARWQRAWEQGELSALVTRLDGSGARCFVTPLEDAGELGAWQAEALALARQRLAGPRPRAGLVQLGGVPHFLDVQLPAPELLLFGAAHDSLALARLARQAGFQLRVVDRRAELLSAERFPGATLHALDPQQLGRLTLGPRSHVVIMNHHFLTDLACLRRALHSDAPYIGLLGPRTRLDKLAAQARDEGQPLSAQQLARVRNPIGLALGAENPEEVAISVVGELMALSRGFAGGFLNGHAGKIHTPESWTAVPGD